VPLHAVASRGGHDPATLLKSYAKRTKKSDVSAAGVVGAGEGHSWEMRVLDSGWPELAQDPKVARLFAVG
jgi:hypothetical protein